MAEDKIEVTFCAEHKGVSACATGVRLRWKPLMTAHGYEFAVSKRALALSHSGEIVEFDKPEHMSMYMRKGEVIVNAGRTREDVDVHMILNNFAKVDKKKLDSWFSKQTAALQS